MSFMKDAKPGKGASNRKWIGVDAIQSPEPASLEAFSTGFLAPVSSACSTEREGAAACRGIAIGM
jgi:hypothetical protein